MTEALKLMLTGMGTVFFILILVVVLGNLIIRFTNLFAVSSEKQDRTGTQDNIIDKSKLAVLVSAVDVVTKGKGKITSIEKVKQ